MAEKIYFAWVDDGEEFDPDVHNREDEDVFSFQFEHQEGDFAGLKLTIKNPRIGLLNAGRKVWGILSFDPGTSVLVPIFRGRLIGVPTNIFDTLVTIDFTARPSDYVSQKIALANTMKVIPYYDPIFVSPDSWADPDVVLEAYSRLWHIDPVTLVVTASDILVAEDGVEVVEENQHFYDDMSVTLNQTPVRAVSMVATIPWTQTSAGGLDLTKTITDLFPSQIPSSFTMTGLIESWPKPGAKFGSGWQVRDGSMTDVSYIMPMLSVPDLFSWEGTVPIIPEGSVIFPLKVTGEIHSGETAGFNLQYELVVASIGFGVPVLTVDYTAGREMAQVVTFTLRTDQQSIVTLPGDDEALVITINANKVSDPTEDASIPIDDVQRRNYTHTDRGLQSIEHLLLVARAHLIAKSRAVEIQFKMAFKEAIRMLSLRKAALVHDHRLPGGEALGKIIGVKLSLDGDGGDAVGEITIASCVGKGGSYTTDPGTPTYADNGYTDDYQEYANQIKLTDTADIAWTVPDPSFFDDGLDFVRGLNSRSAISLATITNGSAAQKSVIEAAGDGPNTDQAKISSVLQDNPTQITIQMNPMEGGPFQQEVVISVSDLIVPQQINLEAASNA
jgi:hypothetical protein